MKTLGLIFPWRGEFRDEGGPVVADGLGPLPRVTELGERRREVHDLVFESLGGCADRGGRVTEEAGVEERILELEVDDELPLQFLKS